MDLAITWAVITASGFGILWVLGAIHDQLA